MMSAVVLLVYDNDRAAYPNNVRCSDVGCVQCLAAWFRGAEAAF